MSYTRINWKNDATTPLNAANLNSMDAAIYDLNSTLTVVQQALVDVANGNDSTGEFNDASKPFKTLDFVLGAIANGSATEIFISGNATAGAKQYRFINTAITFLAYGVGTPDASLDTSKITFPSGFGLHLNANCSLGLYIDVNDAHGAGAEGTCFKTGDGSTLNLLNHRVHDFTNSPSNDGYVANGRESVYTLDANVTSPIVSMFGANSAVTSTSIDIVDTATAQTNLFELVTDSTCSVRVSIGFTKFNGVAATAQTFIDRFTGLKRYGDSKPVNVLAGFDLSSTTGGTLVATHSTRDWE